MKGRVGQGLWYFQEACCLLVFGPAAWFPFGTMYLGRGCVQGRPHGRAEHGSLCARWGEPCGTPALHMLIGFGSFQDSIRPPRPLPGKNVMSTSHDLSPFRQGRSKSYQSYLTKSGRDPLLGHTAPEQGTGRLGIQEEDSEARYKVKLPKAAWSLDLKQESE